MAKKKKIKNNSAYSYMADEPTYPGMGLSLEDLHYLNHARPCPLCGEKINFGTTKNNVWVGHENGDDCYFKVYAFSFSEAVFKWNKKYDRSLHCFFRRHLNSLSEHYNVDPCQQSSESTQDKKAES